MLKFLKKIGLVQRQIQDISWNELSDLIRLLNDVGAGEEYNHTLLNYLECYHISLNNVSEVSRIIRIYEHVKINPICMTYHADTDISAQHVDSSQIEPEEEHCEEESEDENRVESFNTAKYEFESYVRSTIAQTSHLLQHVNVVIDNCEFQGVLVASTFDVGREFYVFEHYGDFKFVEILSNRVYRTFVLPVDVMNDVYSGLLVSYRDAISYEKEVEDVD